MGLVLGCPAVLSGAEGLRGRHISPSKLGLGASEVRDQAPGLRVGGLQLQDGHVRCRCAAFGQDGRPFATTEAEMAALPGGSKYCNI